jgi:hypothetical protein
MRADRFSHRRHCIDADLIEIKPGSELGMSLRSSASATFATMVSSDRRAAINTS